MFALPRQVQFVPGAPGDDVPPVFHVEEKGFLQTQHPWLPTHESQQIDTESSLQGRALEELIEHLARLGSPLQFDDDSYPGAI